MNERKHNNDFILQITTAVAKLQQQSAMMYKNFYNFETKKLNLRNWMNNKNL